MKKIIQGRVAAIIILPLAILIGLDHRDNIVYRAIYVEYIDVRKYLKTVSLKNYHRLCLECCVEDVFRFVRRRFLRALPQAARAASQALCAACFVAAHSAQAHCSLCCRCANLALASDRL